MTHFWAFSTSHLCIGTPHWTFQNVLRAIQALSKIHSVLFSFLLPLFIESDMPHALWIFSVYSFSPFYPQIHCAQLWNILITSNSTLTSTSCSLGILTISCKDWVFHNLYPMVTVTGQAGKWRTHSTQEDATFNAFRQSNTRDPKRALWETTTMVGHGVRRRTVTHRNSRKGPEGVWAEY